MGIIDSLSAGFRLLSRRPQLIIVPVVLDLVLLALPRLSLAPLYLSAAEWYTQATNVEGITIELGDMVAQMTAVLEAMAANSNLWGMLANGALLHVPSLVAAAGMLRELVPALEIANPLLALGLAAVFGLLGVLIGVAFLNVLAWNLPIGTGPKNNRVGIFTQTVLRQSGRVVLFVLAVLLLLLLLYIPVTVGLALVTLISPALGSALAVLFGGMTLVIFFYLYFAIPAMVLDDLGVRASMMQSLQLVRSNVVSTFGFVLLTNLIGLGLGLLFVRLAAMTMAGTLLAIVGNAYIGTGLAMALLIFYRTRILRMAEEVAVFDRRR